MQLNELLPPERVRHDLEVNSKKRALQTLSKILAEHAPGLKEDAIFDAFLARERLGTTGLGRGVAIPHGRMPAAKTAVAAMVKLRKGVDYDAPDSQPVDILIGLVVPENSTEEHLRILACIAEMLASEPTIKSLRSATSDATLFEAVQHWKCSESEPE